MLLSHAVLLAEARSYVAALADHATTFDASMGYERVLLQLDCLHGDDVPPITAVATNDQAVLYGVAEAAIEELVDHGTDALEVELVLAMLGAAHELEKP